MKIQGTRAERATADGERAYQLRHRYGLALEGYAWMLEQQGGACALCPRDATCVDHDHSDGHVRALLCRGCNTQVGQIESQSEHRRRLGNYIEAA